MQVKFIEVIVVFQNHYSFGQFLFIASRWVIIAYLGICGHHVSIPGFWSWCSFLIFWLCGVLNFLFLIVLHTTDLQGLLAVVSAQVVMIVSRQKWRNEFWAHVASYIVLVPPFAPTGGVLLFVEQHFGRLLHCCGCCRAKLHHGNHFSIESFLFFLNVADCCTRVYYDFGQFSLWDAGINHFIIKGWSLRFLQNLFKKAFFWYEDRIIWHCWLVQ